MLANTQLRPGTVTTVLVTPFRDGRLDLVMLETLAERQIRSGIDGLAVCTVTGEGPTLSPTERAAIISTCVRLAAGRVAVIAATGTNATSSTIALTRQAQDLGADAAFVTVPYYSKPGQKGIIRHFEQVAAATLLPVLIDDDPSRCASGLSAESLAALAQVQSIVGVVHAIPNSSPVPAHLRRRFLAFSSDEAHALAFLACGGDGIMSSATNIQPRLFAALYRLTKAGNMSAATPVDARLQPLIKALPDVGDPANVKQALHVLLGMHPDVRLPLVGPDAVEKAALFDALTALAESRTQGQAV